jgi:hypothetical protein
MQAVLGRIELLGHLVRTERGSSNVFGLNFSETIHLLLFLSFFSTYTYIHTICIRFFARKFGYSTEYPCI